MARGIAIHIGVSRPDVAHYGELAQLKGSLNDAEAMARIAEREAFGDRRLLRNEEATVQNVSDALRGAAHALENGDLLLLTFSGHGARLPRGRTPDGTLAALLRPDAESDQTWCLFDRQLIDDELYALWQEFRPGVRILVISDSCYSGSVVKFEALPGLPPVEPTNIGPIERGLTPSEAAEVFDKNEDVYRAIQDAFPSERCPVVDASVILLAACQDCERARDGDPHGAFTAALLAEWNEGAFDGSLLLLHERVYGRLHATTSTYMNQRPAYLRVGAPTTQFDLGRPFTI